MSHVTPAPTHSDILTAIALCDELGVEAFLAEHGYGPSKRYILRHAGRSYPSKAILGVASNLTAREFSGGAAHTARVLGRLGFTVRRGTPRRLDAELAAIAADVAEGFDYAPPTMPDLPVDPVCYFASGTNRPAEIRAFGDIGHDIGVSALQVSKAAEAELLELAGTDVQVFVDSGAFSEVRFGDEGLEVVKPMTDEQWWRVLSLYVRLGHVLGDQLHVVAPDRVGDQAVTMERLARYALELRTLHELGVRVLLPVQRGMMSQADFYRHAAELLGFAPVPALPCKKAATSPAECQAFVADVQPRTVHLLGLGVRNQRAARYLDACRAGRADVMVQLDSVVITAMVGRTNGRGNGPRALTAARDLVATVAELATSAARKYVAIMLAMGAVA